MTTPFVLFVPSYGGGGTGEFVRSVALARALQARWPQVRIEFLLPGGPGTRQDAPFPKTCHDGPEEEKGAFDRLHIERLRPDLVIFDSGCRSETLRLCRRLGIRTAYISDRAGTCRKAFRFDWLNTLDLHWHQREHLTRPPFTPWQRLVSQLSSTQRLLFDTYFSTEPADWNELPQEVRTRLNGEFVLFAPGGGGYRIDGRPVTDVFLDAAEQLYRNCGVQSLTLCGALYDGQVSVQRKTCSLPGVPQPLFIELLRRAALVVTNGGHSLNQTLACGAACIASPLGGDDQPGRIREYAAAGLIEAGVPSVSALAQATTQLMTNPARRAALRARVTATPVVNGIPLMIAAIEAALRLGSAA